MSKRAMAVAEEMDMATSTAVPQEVMAERKRLAGLIRARMAKLATAVDKKLWHELKAEVRARAYWEDMVLPSWR